MRSARPPSRAASAQERRRVRDLVHAWAQERRPSGRQAAALRGRRTVSPPRTARRRVSTRLARQRQRTSIGWPSVPQYARLAVDVDWRSRSSDLPLQVVGTRPPAPRAVTKSSPPCGCGRCTSGPAAPRSAARRGSPMIARACAWVTRLQGVKRLAGFAACAVDERLVAGRGLGFARPPPPPRWTARALRRPASCAWRRRAGCSGAARRRRRARVAAAAGSAAAGERARDDERSGRTLMPPGRTGRRPSSWSRSRCWSGRPQVRAVGVDAVRARRASPSACSGAVVDRVGRERRRRDRVVAVRREVARRRRSCPP